MRDYELFPSGPVPGACGPSVCFMWSVCDLGDIQHIGTQICEISDTFSALSYVAKLPTSQLTFGLLCGPKNVQSLLAMTRWCEPVAENRPLFETRVQNYFKYS